MQIKKIFNINYFKYASNTFDSLVIINYLPLNYKYSPKYSLMLIYYSILSLNYSKYLLEYSFYSFKYSKYLLECSFCSFFCYKGWRKELKKRRKELKNVRKELKK